MNDGQVSLEMTTQLSNSRGRGKGKGALLFRLEPRSCVPKSRVLYDQNFDHITLYYYDWSRSPSCVSCAQFPSHPIQFIMTNTATESVIVRPIKAGDAAAVAQIWRDGLAQTAEGLEEPMRSKMLQGMEEYGANAMREDGDVGPNGCKLMEFWGKEGCVMLVVCLPENPNEVVGAVGVKQGLTYDNVEPDSKEASIWRMSVSSKVRRRGLGRALMKAADEYAQAKFGCTKMGLLTANDIAAKFYTEKVGFQVVPQTDEPKDLSDPRSKIRQYIKEL